ncbi:MAG TPA: sigma-70 family RNA polymerase sigma factor [Xanthobacteraceae bacterium]|jgi:RNA polymerase sigma-70 factor (ECF subfamily)
MATAQPIDTKPSADHPPHTTDDPAVQSGRQSFTQLVEPHRKQIKAYSYRMLGSLHEAEDLTQEAFLRAWRSFDEYEGRSSIKTWLFQIATRACIDALRQRKRLRRILPESEFAPARDMPKGEPPSDTSWLEPFPDSEIEEFPDGAPGPDARYEGRETVRLAFVAAIQYLPPRQRALLLLVDVLGWSAKEAVLLVGGTAASINSVLQRARSTLARRYTPSAPIEPLRLQDDQSTLLNRYVRAWEGKDLEGFVTLLKEEATYAMPPWQHWYLGREAIRNFFGVVWPRYGRFRLLLTRANGQPAFALYVEGKEGGWRAHSLQVVEIDGEFISGLTFFMRPLGPDLFPAFGLPGELENAPVG